MLAQEIADTQQSLGYIQCLIEQADDVESGDPDDREFLALLSAHHQQLAADFQESYQSYLEDCAEGAPNFDPQDPEHLNAFVHGNLFVLRMENTAALAQLYAVLSATPDNEKIQVNSLCDVFPDYPRDNDFLVSLRATIRPFMEEIRDNLSESDPDDNVEEWDMMNHITTLMTKPTHKIHDDFRAHPDFFIPPSIEVALKSLRTESEFLAGYIFQNNDFEGNADLIDLISFSTYMADQITGFVEAVFANTPGENFDETLEIVDKKFRPHICH